MERRVLVTGGAGFVGSNIVDLLIDEGFDVSVVDNFATGNREHINEAARLYECDITSERLAGIVGEVRPDCVIHQAAQISVTDSVKAPMQDATVNILGSINVLESCRQHDVRKVVYASSAALYGDPTYLPVDEKHPVLATSPYGISKHTVEHYLLMYQKLYDLQFTALRYANVYGPRQDPLGEGGVVAIFTNRMLEGKPCTIYGDGEQTRDFVFVGDVARANLLAIDRGDGEILNVSREEETTVNQLYGLLQTVTGVVDAPLRGRTRPGDIERSVLANRKIKDTLGWEPQVDLRTGLEWVVRGLQTP